MRVHCIVHASFENPGVIREWIKKKAYELSTTHTYKGESLPELSQFDFLIVMGGPQSALHLDKWPYLKDEIILIQKTIAARKPLLGICLGAQLIAASLGAKAERSPAREIGLFPVETLPHAAEDPVFSQFPTTFSAMHWHNDMPGLPKEARLLAKSAGCPRQAYAIGDRIYGIQCHLEMTQESIAEMLPHCEAELTPDHYVESKESLLSYDLKDTNQKMLVVLDYLASKNK
jgi:GMP synthase (glutamine-hydrolysing)